MAALFWIAPVFAADSEKPSKPKLDVEGLGWVKNYELERALVRLVGDKSREDFDTNAIEDMAVILFSSLAKEGYLEPGIEVKVESDGVEKTYLLDALLTTPLPRDLRAKRVRLRVIKRERSIIESVEFTGLKAMKAQEARQFFLHESAFALFSRATPFSQTLLRRSAHNLQEDLRQRGYADARVTAGIVGTSPDNDRAMRVEVTVDEGLRWQVAGVEFQLEGGMAVPAGMLSGKRDQVWSRLWEQDATGEIRRSFYQMGYPDVMVDLKPRRLDPAADHQPVTVVAHIKPGKQVRMGTVRFQGNQLTRESVLRRRVRPKAGDLLDPVALERARYRLSALGVFSSVNLRYEPADGDIRDVIFDLREGRRRESSVLIGYGSYERFRGGVEIRDKNIWGRAHQSRLELVQSVKSSRGEYDYRVPELFGEQLDGTVKLFGLQREELSFVRQEYGGSIALQRSVPWIKAQGKVGYTYEALRNKESELATRSSDEEQINVASINFGLTRDRRDNPLRPRRGYRWFLQMENASEDFGGSAEYQRTEFGVAYHSPLGRGRWWHVGAAHGVITTWGTDDTRLPVNKRFFPGGENSIRGYSAGEAAPRDELGQFIGAKTYTLFNLEVEQAVFGAWSLVVFGDALTAEATLKDYPAGDWLYSAGAGIRYQTIIGPLRAEYGRNLNPRPEDPSGSWQISVGFPF